MHKRVFDNPACGLLSVSTSPTSQHPQDSLPVPQVTQCYFEDGYQETSVYMWDELSCDHSIQGPAIIIDKNRCVRVCACVCE